MHVRRPLAVVLAAAATLAAGCGSEAGSDPKSADFKDPQQRLVVAAVEDFSDAAASRDYEKICADSLAAPLVKQLDAAKGTGNCADRIEQSLRDVDETKLAVRDVRIQGTNAVALVQPTGTGDVEPQARFALVKEGSRWKLSDVR